jgi:hypothetical protein
VLHRELSLARSAWAAAVQVISTRGLMARHGEPINHPDLGAELPFLVGESVASEFTRRGLRPVDPALALRLSFLSVAASAMFLPLTYRGSAGSPGRDAIVAELSEIFVRAYRV